MGPDCSCGSASSSANVVAASATGCSVRSLRTHERWSSLEWQLGNDCWGLWKGPDPVPAGASVHEFL